MRASLLLLPLFMTACQTSFSTLAPTPQAPLSAQNITGQTVANEVVVRLQAGTSPQAYAQRHGLQLVLNIGLDMYIFRSTARSPQQLRSDRSTRWAEPNYRISLPRDTGRPAPATVAPRNPETGPNDPLLPAQYNFSIMGVDKVWPVQKGSPDVVVAVIDSGIDGSHPEFQGQLVPGWDLTAKVPGPGGNVDGYGHGTHVAGVIGALANNGLGVAGLASGCKLMPVRIFNDFGHSTSGISAAAIVWAIDHGAKVINASWGSPMQSQADKDALRYAIEKGVVFVTAVGNSGKNDTEYYPGAAPEAIGVSATTDIDTWASFSTFGPWVDVAAPGKGILSTYPVAKGSWRIMEGTSMASPAVAAAAALVRSQYPHWSAEQVRAQLERTAKDVIMNGKDDYAGHGRVDIARAVLEAPPSR
jgi:thermitase